MYVSMTGYGSASAEREWGSATLEISSVNHRYQEISARLPKEMSSCEPRLHSAMRSKFRRGKVQIRVEIARSARTQTAAIDREALAHYYREISAARDELGTERYVSLDVLIGLPGVLDAGPKDGSPTQEEAESLLDELLDAACASWDAMRRTEGEHLAASIGEHLTELERSAGEIRSRWAGAKDAAFAALRARITEMLEGIGAQLPSEDRFAQEAALIADKWDIAEELARLDSHIKKFRETGESSEAIGRKLDFIVQEMNREVNTINSKVQDADIRWLSIEAKASIERMREQIQNLE